MAKSSDYRMAIKIAGEIEKSLYNSTDLTRKELNKIAREAARTSSLTRESFAQGLQDTAPFFDGLEKAGVKAFHVLTTAATATGTAIAGIGVASANVGVDFESAFAGVKKTTEATAEEYGRMKQEIMEMTREIPAAGTEIAAVAEAAGQLGIEKDNLLAFSKTMIDLGESTNLSSEEAATALAKFANITNMETQYYDELGSVIVDLGNNFATTEADIVSMATRLASSGELAGFTEAQIMAMSTAMSSVGIEAEAGGSAMSKMIKNVQVAVETGSEDLKDYAKVAGMSVNDFKVAFEKDGLTAVAAFVSGLNDVERNGKSATVILDEMGLTEVRLSNTLLSLANADGLMLEAVKTANKAWEENVALTNEAAQRYETTESKLAIMKNSFTEMGITMYDQFNEPLRDGIDMVTELVHEATAEIAGSTVVHDIAQDIINGTPTAVRILKQTTEAVGDFAQPFLAVGGWLADNPKLLTSTIVGVGSALTTYKVAKGITSVASAFTSLGAAAVPVLGIVGGITAVAGVGTYFAQLDAELTQANLEEHFGSIALSMEEVNEAARSIVGDQYLNQLDELMSASITSDNLIKSMEESIREIDAQRWKLSVGLSFSEEDNEEYARTAQQYIADVQEFINNEGYTFELSAELLLDGSVNMEEIIADNNTFYAQLGEEMQGIGDEVSRIINESLESGLEIDQEEIDGLLARAQEIQEALAKSEANAELETLKARYSGADLSSESIQNVLQEAMEYQSGITEDAWQIYNDNIARLDFRKEMDKSYTQEQYEAEKAEFLSGTQNTIAQGQINVMDFLHNTLADAYGSEAVGDIGELDKKLTEYLNNNLEIAEITGVMPTWDSKAVVKELGIEQLSGRDGEAIAELWKQTEPVYDQMAQTVQSYMQEGKAIPENFRDAIMQGAYMGMLAGDSDSVNNAMAITKYESDEYWDVFKDWQDNGIHIEDSVTAGVTEPLAGISDGISRTNELLENGLNIEFGFMGGRPQYMNSAPSFTSNNSLPQYMNPAPSLTRGYAEGGIVTKPEIAWLAEGGYSESIIPHDGSPRSISLWQQTGEILGVFNRKDGFHALKENILNDGVSSGSSTSNIVNNSEDSRNIVFSPTIQINGNADSRDVENGTEAAFERFQKFMERYERNKERFSFQ